MDELYIGDRLVDLLPSQVIAITKSDIEIADLTSRYVSYSGQFKASPTENNDITFGFSSNEASSTSKPYRILRCRLLQDGIQTLNGFCRISSFDGGYTLTLLEISFSLFNSLNGKKLKDVGVVPDSIWDRQTMDALRTSTNGIVSALLKWKNDSIIFDAEQFLPCFYYHTIITEILESTGLSVSGDILSDSRFTDLVMPFAGNQFVYDNDSVTTPAYSAKGTKNESTGATVAPTYPSVSAGDLIVILALNQQTPTVGSIATPSGFSDGGEKTFSWGTAKMMYKIASGSETGTETITRSGSNGVGTYFMAQFYRFIGSGLTIEDLESDSDTSSTVDYGAVTVAGTARTLVALTVNFDGAGVGTPTGYTENAVDGSTLISGTTLKVASKTLAYSDGAVTATGSANGWASWHLSIYGTTPYNVKWSELWPDVDCKEIIKDFFTRFAIIPKVNEETVVLKTIEEIITNRFDVMDWSEKLTKTIVPIGFGLEYAQNNNFDFKDNEFVDDPTLGRGVLSVDNETLPFEKTYWTSVFENVRTFRLLTFASAMIDVYTGSTGIENMTEPSRMHLLTLKDRTTEDPVTFWTTSRTDYKLAYFLDVDLPKDTGFSYFLGQFYPSLTTALQRFKKVVKIYHLTPVDIHNYDPHKLVYDGDGYYLVNKINNFVNGELTRVELFKVG